MAYPTLKLQQFDRAVLIIDGVEVFLEIDLWPPDHLALVVRFGMDGEVWIPVEPSRGK